MIKEITGDLLDSPAEALVNTVNTVGVMGKGIALQFKKKFPNNFMLYKKACQEGKVVPGKMFITTEQNLLADSKIIINFPTKTTWKKPSEYQYIQEGLADLKKLIETQHIKSIAIPSLGVGHGGLDWSKVRKMIFAALGNLDCTIYLYQPNYKLPEKIKAEKVKLTPARAMLLAIFYDLIKEGEFVSEFAGEKVAYFLQRLGGQEAFKNLIYKPYFYGPYSGKVNHVLHYLNGSYLKGYYSKDKKPFEEIELIMDAEATVLAYLNKPQHKKYKAIVDKTSNFLSGFYSPFGLELLSTIDYICQEQQSTDLEKVKEALHSWSSRKTKHFSNERYIQLALKQLKNSGLYDSLIKAS
ncbi:putative phosphatase, C-terminal domain of histone macro H2A1 like protein [Saprospira grandis DSM 2844]|uniref:Putative phosphatase, C-terminal domain of histone macro H2A1 like protein n=1 Tax=Saprospira grandis DSM 2844 TaxID=694433 RepID=J1I631_9BACT|nr:macro domain-containing protein [Saprospira grandis]EJF54215.1 putative phosphatase, C-terminal domain of histone macro H2A1 like protein [Saprospira grandis DSM 2844]